MSKRAGHFVQQQAGADGYSAFIPAPLPPDPPVILEGETARLHEAAAYALGRLGGSRARRALESRLTREDGLVAEEIRLALSVG